MHIANKLRLLLLLLVPACPAVAQAPAASASEVSYALGPGDIIEVEIVGQADFGKPRVKVKPDGTVSLPMVGSLSVANLDPSRVGAMIRARLIAAQLYTDPAVNVEIVGYASRYVIVLGAVAQPGLVPIDRPYRVSEIIARVGGLKEAGADHVVLSSANGVERKIPIAALARSGPNDPYVAPADKLFVPQAEIFYIYGQVNAPGAYTLREGMTLRQALARGGGLTASGSEKKLTLYRSDQKLKRPLDTRLEPGDVVVVGERLF